MANAINVNTNVSGRVVRRLGSGAFSGPDPAFTGNYLAINARTPNSSASLDFTTMINLTANNYKLEIMQLLFDTTAISLLLDFSTDNGASWDNTPDNYEYGLQMWTLAATPVNTAAGNSTNAAYIPLTQSNFNNTKYVSGEVSIIGTNLSRTSVFFKTGYFNGTAWVYCYGSGVYKAGPINAVRLRPSSGLILSSGFCKIYGMGPLGPLV